ncbi:recombinase family protein [Streptomyces sp. NPDC058357]|uniref:recombinase family protein n=1 Tax=unclassified Streptomyces TaxID=2593676 RepID=UPI0036698DDE
MPTPAVRKPDSAWTELPRPARASAEPVGHIRLGYARASTARQSLDAQLDSLGEAGATRVFSEKTSTRATKRPELEAAVKLAGEIRSSGVAVTLVVHEHNRLGRGIELAMLAEELKASDVGLEFLTGELKGSHDPSGIVQWTDATPNTVRDPQEYRQVVDRLCSFASECAESLCQNGNQALGLPT